MDLMDKLQILTDAAKYDVACTSSGVDRDAMPGQLGSTTCGGICHSFAADGRCITLLKVLMTNVCSYDCKYCVNRSSNDVQRTAFTPRELADLTIGFYRRNYIEGLFLSSGVTSTPDHAMEQMARAIEILRHEYGFRGYIHAKAIPGASDDVVRKLGLLVDRMSLNIELPSEEGLRRLAPDKHKSGIVKPMGFIRDGIKENREVRSIKKYRDQPKFVPAGQSTQMIVGATPDNDFQILRLTDSLYKKFSLKRVFFSAYMPVVEDALLPQTDKVQLLREHRLYQADWLLRFYRFDVGEIISPDHPWLDPLLDPKCNWAMNHLDLFPVEVNRAPYDMLLRVPGIGVTGAKRIVKARRHENLRMEHLKKLRITLKRAKHFITCSGQYGEGLTFDWDQIYGALTTDAYKQKGVRELMQPRLPIFDTPQLPTREDVQKCLTGQI